MSAPLFKQVEEAIEEMKLIPMWGSLPAFPFEKFCTLLSSALHIPKLNIAVEKAEWRKGNFLDGMGEDPFVSCLEMTPLTEPFFLVLSKEDVDKVVRACLSTGQESKGFSTPSFQEGFYTYLLLEAMHALDELSPFSGLSARMRQETPVSDEEESYCLDLRVGINKQKAWARVVCPAAFHREFQAHLSQRKFSLSEADVSLLPALSLTMNIGNVRLPLSTWKKAQVGDLLVLDRCTLDPTAHKGSVELTLGKTPLFRGRIKHNQINIIDYAFYHEETMDHKETGEDEGGEFAEEAPEQTGETSAEEILSTHEIPLTLTVEIGRLQLPLKKILEMKPGNLLELGITPEQGVDLTIEGQRVAKGELVKIGELLGVKILRLSS